MTDYPFDSLESFRQAFTSGLSELLKKGGLGPFILVCANAGFDRRVHEATAAELKEMYLALRDEYVDSLAQGRMINAVEEDLMVFLKLHAVGFDRLQPTETRHAGNWEVQFNQLRSFRPRRISSQVPQHLHLPFDDNGFHFNRPFMLKEAFWGGEMLGKRFSLYYNKYPFVDFHGLLVLERERKLPQFLDEERHEYMWQLTQDLSRTLDGVGFGYNSLGAFASVNHLHFQMFVKPAGLPVMSRDWQHNGGGVPYPTLCEIFYSAGNAWKYIHKLHRMEQPYNLLYGKNCMYVFPRLKQGTYNQPEWTSGFAWHEMAGGMITFNRDSYLNLEPLKIAQALARVSVPIT